jgi:ribonuclease HII
MLLPYLNKNNVEAGVDEAGRGCYAGPVFAAAVILPVNFFHPLLNDSKKLTEGQRNILKPIIEQECLAYHVAKVSAKEIDEINILQASFKAMHIAITGLSKNPNHLLIDGNRFKPYQNIPHTCIIKGDGKYAAIAAASILAKTYRDEYMQNLHNRFPEYHWYKNKGYGTIAHRQAIAEFGLCKEHRKSYKI